jgi:hypothetical protein
MFRSLVLFRSVMSFPCFFRAETIPAPAVTGLSGISVRRCDARHIANLGARPLSPGAAFLTPGEFSSVPLQLPLAPVRFFAVGEDALDVPVERPHDADPRQHRRPATCRDEYEGLHRGLPLWRLVLGLGKLRDVAAGVLECDQRSAARQVDRRSSRRDDDARELNSPETMRNARSIPLTIWKIVPDKFARPEGGMIYE